MSLRERKKLATRNALINTARRLFIEKGYDATTLEEICDEVQIHVTTFFSYFESKEELAFARTIEMLEAFKQIMRDPAPGTDIMSLWWKFFYEFALRARGVEHTIMATMDKVPALRNRYANIVRQYEEELAAALAREAGNDPKEDLYAQLMAANLLGTIVSGARWHSLNFGPDTEGPDTAVFAKMILSRFPSRAEIDAERLRLINTNGPRKAQPRASKSAAEAQPALSRKSRHVLNADAAGSPALTKPRPAASRSK
jgi:AcrR family transcriptional regulator